MVTHSESERSDGHSGQLVRGQSEECVIGFVVGGAEILIIIVEGNSIVIHRHKLLLYHHVHGN